MCSVFLLFMRPPLCFCLGLAGALALLAAPAAGQNAWTEKFQDNAHGWQDKSSANRSIELGGGSYHVKYTSANPTNMVLLPLAMNFPDKGQPFALEATFRATSSAGLMWGNMARNATDRFMLLSFEKTDNGPRLMGRMFLASNGTMNVVLNAPLPANFDVAAVHTLRMFRQDGNLFFGVDGKLLDQKLDAARAWPDGSRNIGFQLQKQGDEFWASQMLFGDLPPLTGMAGK